MRYLDLVEVYKSLGNTSKRLEKTKYIADLISRTPSPEIGDIMLLLEGKVFPAWQDRKIGVADRLIIKAIGIASGRTLHEIETMWKRTGDLGTVASELIGKKQQMTLGRRDLTVNKVMSNLRKLANLGGEGSSNQKVQLVAELLGSASGEEARYLVRTVLEDLRVGAGEGSIRDAIVWALFGKELGLVYDAIDNELKLEGDSRDKYNSLIEAVDDAYGITNDFGEVALAMRKHGLKAPYTATPGKPIKAMLFQKAADIDEAFDIVSRPAALEYKYDGFRVQIHKQGKHVWLFTRRLEDVTHQFPDIVKAVLSHVSAESCILDSEAVAISKGKNSYLPFQSISQRIRRKHDIRKMALLYPVEVNVFDALYLDGRSIMDRPFSERRALLLKNLDPIPRVILPSRLLLTDKKDEAMRFYNEALDMGNEGMMAKSLEAPYRPGKRVGYGVKIKPVMDSLDLVIVGAEWGEGKRARLLTSYVLACASDNGLLEVGRVSTGLKELEEEGTTFRQMTELLEPNITNSKGKVVTVKPSVVIEVQYEEIQRSPSYGSGFALRFPRFVRLRDDRGPRDIDNIETLKRLFSRQRNRDRT
jgi:DNA ligase 1